MIQHLALVTLLSLFSYSALAEPQDIMLFCTRSADVSCHNRSAIALEKLGCSPELSSIRCQDAASYPHLSIEEMYKVAGKDICTISSQCEEPSYGLFGQTSCAGSKDDLKSVDHGLSLTVFLGFTNGYATSICH